MSLRPSSRGTRTQPRSFSPYGRSRSAAVSPAARGGSGTDPLPKVRDPAITARFALDLQVAAEGEEGRQRAEHHAEADREHDDLGDVEPAEFGGELQVLRQASEQEHLGEAQQDGREDTAAQAGDRAFEDERKLDVEVRGPDQPL